MPFDRNVIFNNEMQILLQKPGFNLMMSDYCISRLSLSCCNRDAMKMNIIENENSNRALNPSRLIKKIGKMKRNSKNTLLINPILIYLKKY